MPIKMETHHEGHKLLLGLVMPTYKRVRVEFNGHIIADTPNALILCDHLYAPRYLFHKDDVNMDVLTDNGQTSHNRMYASIKHYDVVVDGQTAEDAALNFAHAKGDQTDIGDYIGFEWDAMDHWYVEDEETFGHARHPYHRIDVRGSSRRVKVAVNGKIVADSTHALFLFETGLPARYYIPAADIQMDLLSPVDTHTYCPYKGTASYYDINVGDTVVEDGAWYYPETESEMERIKDYIAFYNEHEAITITVDKA